MSCKISIIKLIAIAAVMLSGCTNDSDVLPEGEGGTMTFQLSTRAGNGIGEGQQVRLFVAERAQEHSGFPGEVHPAPDQYGEIPDYEQPEEDLHVVETIDLGGSSYQVTGLYGQWYKFAFVCTPKVGGELFGSAETENHDFGECYIDYKPVLNYQSNLNDVEDEDLAIYRKVIDRWADASSPLTEDVTLTRQTGDNAGKNGRIMFVTGVRNNGKLYNYAVYSDDNGLTWKVSEQAFAEGDESKVAELNDGTILMSVRNSNGCRGYARSTDGGETWTEQGTWSDLNVNACNGDILEYTAIADGDDKNRTLHSLPINDGRKQREKISVYLSYDEGQTWERKKQLFGGLSAYSTMIKLPDGTIGIYAEDQQGNKTSNYFMRFSLSWLTDGEDSYNASIDNTAAADNSNSVLINASNGCIEITAADTLTADIYNIDGLLVKSSTVQQTDVIPIPSGAYIVKAGDTTQKVIVM